MTVINDLLQPKSEVLEKDLEGVIHAYRVEEEERLESDARRFFNSTYPSNAIKNVLDLVNDKLSYKSAKGNFVLSGPRGSGKSHALVTLYHIFQHPDEANGWLKNWSIDLDLPQNSRSIIVSAQNTDPDFLWEPIFEKAGREDLLNEIERFPTTDTIEKLVGDDVFAVFLDEFGTWWETFESDESEKIKQNEMFIQNLAEVAEEKNFRLFTFVTTYGTVGGLDKTLNRTDPYREDMSATGDREEIIFHRFFEENKNAVNKQGIRDVVESYTENYKPPIQIDELKRYEKNFIASYPFHPQLLDRLDSIYEGAQNERQNVRGEMTVLANVLADKYNSTDVITLSDLNPKAFMGLDRELVNRYLSDAEKRVEDVRHGEDILKVILMYSFEGDVGASKSDILLGTYKPTAGMNLSDLSMGLEGLHGKANYLHKSNSHYAIKKEVEVYALVKREVQNYSDQSEEVEEELKSLLRNEIFGSKSIFIYELEEDQIKDNYENKIVVTLKSYGTEDNLKNELNDFLRGRQYQNNLVFIIPKAENLLTDRRLLNKVKRIVAGREIKRGLDEESEKVDRILEEDKGEAIDYLEDLYGHWIKWVAREGRVTFIKKPVQPTIREIRDKTKTDRTQLKEAISNYVKGSETGIGVDKILSDFKQMRKHPYVSNEDTFYSVLKELNREKLTMEGDRGKKFTDKNPTGEIKDDWAVYDIDYVSRDQVIEDDEPDTIETTTGGYDFNDEDIPDVTEKERTKTVEKSAGGNSPRAVENQLEMSLDEGSISRITDLQLDLGFKGLTKEELLDLIKSLPDCQRIEAEIEVEEIVED